jgi:hypothetical protein
MLEAMRAGLLIVGVGLVLTGADAGVTMTGLELNQRTQGFALGGGGHRFVVAITREPDRPGYTFPHWAGFFSTKAISSSPELVMRPTPPFLLVSNGPVNVESRNQEVVEELVRWEPDGTLVTTGIVYSKNGGPGRSTDAFRAAAALLLAK